MLFNYVIGNILNGNKVSSKKQINKKVILTIGILE